MQDTYRHKGLRQKLVDSIRKKGFENEEVLNALNKVPRHLFFDSAFLEKAYVDKAFPIGAGQTISQPFTVAIQTHLLQVKRGNKVLEVGTGSGYQAAILAELGAKVFTIERQKELFTKSQKTLNALGYRGIKFFYGDGYAGKPTYGPFDKIIITCGAPEVPTELIKQLKTGGCMVAPIGKGDVQEMHRIIRKSENEIDVAKHGAFSFVPMLKGLQ